MLLKSPFHQHRGQQSPCTGKEANREQEAEADPSISGQQQGQQDTGGQMRNPELHSCPVESGEGKFKAGQQWKHPGNNPQHKRQQCGKDGGSRQDRSRLLNDGSNQPAKPQQSGQRRAPQQGGRNRSPQFPAEGPEEPGIDSRLILPYAVDGGVIQRGGGRPCSCQGNGAKQPQNAQDHHIQQSAAPTPEEGVRPEEISHITAAWGSDAPEFRPG